jgi:hypothetical protein
VHEIIAERFFIHGKESEELHKEIIGGATRSANSSQNGNSVDFESGVVDVG